VFTLLRLTIAAGSARVASALVAGSALKGLARLAAPDGFGYL
jgi:hypothetical protein